MENSIYLGLSRQMALQTNLEIVAQNVANVNTPGYRGQTLMFQEYLSDPKGADDELSFVYDSRQYQDTEPGSVKYTGNPLDIALDGPGFFKVTGPNGQQAFTRAGNFLINVNGELTTPDGYLVGDTGGNAITIPRDSSEINIDDSGFVSNQNGVVGQIGMSEFANVQDLEAIGHNLFIAPDGGEIEALETRMRQGHLEGSNVKPVLEMTKMIDLLRNYQATQNVIQTEGDRLKSAIQRLTRSA